jgi:hypothetical protein
MTPRSPAIRPTVLVQPSVHLGKPCAETARGDAELDPAGKATLGLGDHQLGAGGHLCSCFVRSTQRVSFALMAQDFLYADALIGMSGRLIDKPRELAAALQLRDLFPDLAPRPA